MIRPPDLDGVAFSEAPDGDLRSDQSARAAASRRLGIPADWARVRQVHGTNVVRADRPGALGKADALWTSAPGVPVAVFTADCFGVVLVASGAVGVAHAGWRGASGKVVTRLREAMSEGGYAPREAAVGPGIGSCCFEVGPDVLARFPGHEGETTWRTPSADLRGAVVDELVGLRYWVADGCTAHEERWFSHRRTGTAARLAAIGWVP